jgi:hypothetical protein
MNKHASYSDPAKRCGIRGQQGYSLLELVVVMAIFIIVTIITTTAFDRLISTGRREGRTAASQIEGVVGLEMLRRDIAHAGYGLPTSYLNTPATAFPEVTGPPAAATGVNATSFNEIVPHAVACGTAGVGATNPGTDYLVIKSALLPHKGANTTAGRWGYLNYSTTPAGEGASEVKTFGEAERDLRPNDYVMVLANSLTAEKQQVKELLNTGTGTTSSTFSFKITGFPFIAPTEFQPKDRNRNYIVYGISSVAPRMPYNRADYYVSRPPAGDPNFKIPSSCNPGTGILFKAVADHSGGYTTPYPLLNCVGDMKVALTLDQNDNGNLSYFPPNSPDIATLSLQDLRAQIRSIMVFILTHEGKKDPTYSYPRDTLFVGPEINGTKLESVGKVWSDTELRAQFGSDWKNYRWKVYTLIVTPTNM